MNTPIQTELIARFIVADRPTLDGFDPEHLPEAVIYRLQRLASRGSFDRDFTEAEIHDLQNLTHPEPVAGFISHLPNVCEGDQSRYFLFGDGSLYFGNNAQDEVWSEAADFATDRILNGYEGPLAQIDAALLSHLGRFYAEAVTERGVRA